MDIQANEIIKIFINNQLLAFPVLGVFATLLLILTWKQVKRSWYFYKSKRKFLEHLEFTLAQNS